MQALVVSRLDYANSLLYGVPKRLLDKLQKVQNAAARIVACVGVREHITPTLIELHWLPMEKRVHYKILVLTHKSLHGLAPSHLCQALEQPPQRNRRHQHEDKLIVPRNRCKTVGGRAFRVAAPSLWNELPASLRDNNLSLPVFKKKLKTFLFRLSYL